MRNAKGIPYNRNGPGEIVVPGERDQALAGMAGKKDQNGSLTGRLFIHKSIIGSIVFFISSFIISFIVFTFFSYSVKEIFVWALILAAVTTVVELITGLN